MSQSVPVAYTLRRAAGLVGSALTLLAAACAPATPSAQSTSASTSGDAAGRTGQVVPGIEVLLRDSLHLIRGKRVGLITNHTGIGRNGVSSADLLARTPGVRLTALFGPEHGIRGQAQDGVTVNNSVDSATGAIVYSLYGATRVPTAEMMRNVDVLLYDIQDVGARTYTYPWTMALSADTIDKPFIVLDRPNPIRADVVQGGVLEPQHRTFVGQYPVALRYGMTAGELMRYLIGTKQVSVTNVMVVPMQNYRRSMWWDETGMPWVGPSPNLQDVEAAMVYTGTVLFEGTTMSEGRGTDAPLKQVGAKWLTDAPEIAAVMNAKKIPGVRFEARTIPVRAGAKQAGEAVPFIRFHVTDRNALRPVEAAVLLMREIYARHAKDFGWSGTLTRLAGTEALRPAIESGRVEPILERWARESRAFEATLAPYRLYPQ